MDTTQVETVRSMTSKEMAIAIFELQKQVASLVAISTPARNDAQREMTDADAKECIASTEKHNVIAKRLGLSYGQIYSCRLEFTFKHVHKAMKEAGEKNIWAKA